MAEFFDKWKRIISEKVEEVSKKTGEIAEVVVDKAGDVVTVVANKTEQTVEVQKIKSQIHVMERNNERDFTHIGKMIYHKFKKGEDIDAQYAELCEVIAEREACIEESKAEIAKIKGNDVCPNCDAHLENGAKFFSKCGTQID